MLAAAPPMSARHRAVTRLPIRLPDELGARLRLRRSHEIEYDLFVRFVRRLPAILSLVFLLSQGAGLNRLSGLEVCRQSCPDDDARGNCGPGCSDCQCCSHPRPVTASVNPVLPARMGSRPGAVATEVAPSDIEPQEIDHVPKPGLA